MGIVLRSHVRSYPSWRTSGLMVVFLLGISLRLGRLSWQPLWADEGYSVYFASETLGRMAQLTAQDIHPPLYYALLHGWLALVGTPTPLTLRLFSLLAVLPAFLLLPAFARRLFPKQERLPLLAALLLACNPFLLFYSQEVRMYGLAVTLSLTSSLCLWQAIAGPFANQHRWWLGYILSATAALYTLYYTAFLLIAHLLWTILALPRAPRRDWRALFIAQVGVALLFFPWLFYTATTLVTYVENKVQADQDVALPPLVYLSRHLLTFVGGHLLPPTPWGAVRWLGVAALVGLSVGLLLQWWRSHTVHHLPTAGRVAPGTTTQAALIALSYFLFAPMLIAFAINLRFPFFPDGGERLLLFVLPYFLLLVAAAIDGVWAWGRVGQFALLLLLLVAGVGIGLFYTQPRHQTMDYRPLVRQIVQQGTETDTVLATFPWQVGLWRVYAPLSGLPPDHGPRLRLLSDGAVRWEATVAQAVDEALAQGTLWLPLLRSIGSTLPDDFARYLEGRAVNLADGWYGETTLTAWHTLEAPPRQATTVSWEGITLTGVGVTPTTAAAANTPIRVDLAWQGTQANGVTLRLLRDGHQWGGRDLTTLASPLGFVIGAGLPPGEYQLLLGLTAATPGGESRLVPTLAGDTTLVPVATIQVTAPAAPLLAARLPIQHRLTTPAQLDDLRLLGYSGATSVPLAGEHVTVNLFWQKAEAGTQDHLLYISLLDDQGAGVAGWEGWPLPDYPTTAWEAAALAQVPVTFPLPPTLPTGRYQLGVGLLDPTSGAKSPIVRLGEQAAEQRQANFTPVAPPIPLPAPAQFGTHVQLQGYSLARQGNTLTLQLYWQVLQSLWPPHHIFVHVADDQGKTLTQADGEPQSSSGRAPTGSWLPGETLITRHQLTVTHLPNAAQLRVGLYLPETEARLPVSINGQSAGDAVTLAITPN